MRVIPPLRALQAFEAAARHSSVQQAAGELRVTPSAVSHQLKVLEDHLGVRLFHRLHRRIVLTDAGRLYRQSLASVFDRVELATRHVVEGGVSDVLTVHCPPSFAPAWLVPRLAGFLEEHPGTDLRIRATPEPPEFFRSDTDVEIRYGTGDWPGLKTVLLLEDFVAPLATPAVLRRLGLLVEPTDVLSLPLIHSERALVGWPEWCRALGLAEQPSRSGLRFDRAYLALQAASEGLGVALESLVFAARELAAGALVPLLDPERARVSAGGHYLVYPAIYDEVPKVRAFRDWVQRAARPSAAEAARSAAS